MIVHILRPFEEETLVRIEDESRLTLGELAQFASLVSDREEFVWFSLEEQALLDPDICISELPVADQDHLLLYPDGRKDGHSL